MKVLNHLFAVLWFPFQAHASQIARQHFHLRLKRKVLLAWHSLTQKEWKVRMEQACRTKAEEVCTQLSENYEAQIQTVGMGPR